MTVSGPLTTHGIPKFADTDVPDLGAGGVGSILDTLDGLIGAYKIAATTVGVGGAATIDFTNIPQTFSHLRLVALLLDTGAVTIVRGVVRINGNTTNNYTWGGIEAPAGTPVYTNGTTTGWGQMAYVGASGSYAQGGVWDALFPDYANALTAKALHGVYTALSAANSAYSGISAGTFAVGGAISRLTLLPGSTAFAQGSRATLWGLP